MELFIDKNIFSTKVKLNIDSKLFNFDYAFNLDKNLIGNIYIGKIINVLPNMKSIFIDIGLNKNAYLDFKDIKGRLTLKEITTKYKIGNEIIVQVNKNSIDKKGAKVSEDVSIPSNNVVLLPHGNKIYISKKITDRNKVSELSEKLDKIRQDYGIIVRSNAENIDSDKIVEELKNLLAIWDEINQKKSHRLSNKMVYNTNNEYNQFIMDYYYSIKNVTVNSMDIYNELINMDNYHFNVTYKENLSLSKDLFYLNSDTIYLENGINLKIDYTEALTVIDVNSGKFISNNNLNGIYQVNSYALKEIAKQINIRNISGIIIIDLINFKNTALQKKLMNEFYYELNKYKSKFNVFGFTKTGLLEMTKQYTNNSLNNLFSDRKYEADLIFSKLLKIVRTSKSKKLEINCSAECIAFLNSNQSYNTFLNNNNFLIKYVVSDIINVFHKPF